MPDYKSMYLLLFDRVVESIEHLKSAPFTPNTKIAIDTLVGALLQCEELYVDSSQPSTDNGTEEERKPSPSVLPPIRIIPNK